MPEEHVSEPRASEQEAAPSKLERLIEEYRRRAARDHFVALLCVGMMLVSIGAAVVVFVFAGQIAINDVLAARTRQLEITSEFIAEEGPRITALVQQLAPAIEEVGVAATAVAQPMGAFSRAADALEETYDELVDMARALVRLTETLEDAAFPVAEVARKLAWFAEELGVRISELESEDLAFHEGDLRAVSDGLHDLHELAYKVNLEGTLRDAGQFFHEGVSLLSELRAMTKVQREGLRSAQGTTDSVRRIAERTLAGIDEAKLVIHEAGGVVNSDDPAPMLGDLQPMSTLIWTTRASASVVLAGLLYALSVIYRNSRVSERRSNDIITALVLSEGRDDVLDRVVRLLTGAIDEPKLVSPAHAAPLPEPPKAGDAL